MVQRILDVFGGIKTRIFALSAQLVHKSLSETYMLRIRRKEIGARACTRRLAPRHSFAWFDRVVAGPFDKFAVYAILHRWLWLAAVGSGRRLSQRGVEKPSNKEEVEVGKESGG
jgi:hypothetical protein